MRKHEKLFDDNTFVDYVNHIIMHFAPVGYVIIYLGKNSKLP